MYWNYENKNIPRAKALRKEMTPHERKLWYCFLRGYPVKFLRQRSIGNYIVDFYCSATKLAVELDGGQHYEEEKLAYDAMRDKELGAMGVAMRRFTNTQIDREFEAVKAEIDRVVRELTPQSADADSSPR